MCSRLARAARKLAASFALAALNFTTAAAPQETGGFDALARIYAGLDRPVRAVRDDPRQAFRQRVESSWRAYQKAMGIPMAAWARTEIGFPGGGTVFYPFSGPDLVTAAQLFPGADRYVLVSIQNAQAPADLDAMTDGEQRAFREKFAREWHKFGALGFFRTDDLNDDARTSGARIGVTSILMTFAARIGFEVLEVSPIAFNRDSAEFEKTDGPWKSVRLLLRKEGRTTVVDYVRADLSNRGLEQAPALRSWMARMAQHPTLLKAASHLLQEAAFSNLRDMLVDNTRLLVQDETGLDYRDLKRIGDITLYGHFSRPHRLFNRRNQESLVVAYRQAPELRELPFSFSYNKAADLRSIQIARRKPQSFPESGSRQDSPRGLNGAPNQAMAETPSGQRLTSRH